MHITDIIKENIELENDSPPCSISTSGPKKSNLSNTSIFINKYRFIFL